MTPLINKLSLALAIIAGATLVPIYASAQEAENPEAQIFTACSQAAIEVRDSAIGSARTAYNNTMSVALDARKEAEKKAVALADASEKKNAIKVAVEDYKKSVTQAQESLIKARKESWARFESDMKACRDGLGTIIQDATLQAKSELKAEIKAAVENKSDNKSLKETFFESLRNFFKKGTE